MAEGPETHLHGPGGVCDDCFLSYVVDRLRDDEELLHAAQLAITARRELREAREAVGEAWLAGGVTLAEAIRRKTAALETLAGGTVAEAQRKLGKAVASAADEHIETHEHLAFEVMEITHSGQEHDVEDVYAAGEELRAFVRCLREALEEYDDVAEVRRG